MTAPAFEEVPMPEPAILRTLHADQYPARPFLVWGYTADQLRAYGDQRANAALEEAAKLRKLIADHNDECVRMCDSRFAYGPTQCPMRAYNRQCTDCPKDGMVEVPALKKENGQ
jgi:hypothetical protein